MAASFRWIPVTVAVAGVLLIVPPSEAAGTRTLLLRVRDYTSTRPATLAGARSLVASILESLRIPLVWRDGPRESDEPCDQADCLDLEIHLVGARNTHLSTGDETLGLAIVDEGGPHAAFIFEDRVLGFAERHQLDQGRLLGHVIAHEVGHLLLSSRTHARGGLMRARWTPDFLRQRATLPLAFTDREAAAIRHRLLASETVVARR